MEYNACDIKQLAQLFKTGDDTSDSDDDLPKNSKLGPGDIKPQTQVKIKFATEECDNSEVDTKKPKSKDIWNVDEVSAVPFCDDASYDPRQRPEFDIKYRQAITSEDVFLQLGRKTPSTASCEVMVISMCLKGEQKEDVDLQVTRSHLDIRSPLYRLSLPLPHPAEPDASSAEWDPVQSTLTVSLALSRELDFTNF